MTRIEIIADLRKLSDVLKYAPRCMTIDGAAVKALVPVSLVAAVVLAVDELGEELSADPQSPATGETNEHP